MSVDIGQTVLRIICMYVVLVYTSSFNRHPFLERGTSAINCIVCIQMYSHNCTLMFYRTPSHTSNPDTHLTQCWEVEDKQANTAQRCCIYHLEDSMVLISVYPGELSPSPPWCG